MTGPTILIGLDGATFTVLDALMERGVMPFLREFVAEGVRAPLRSVVPALTPPAWTSLMTGRRPGRHGIFDFFQKQEADSRYLRFATSQDIGCETIWSLASAHGRRVNVLNFPLTFPAPAVDGCVVPGGWMPWRQLRLGCRPAGLFDRLKGLPSFNARELAMDMALEEKTLEGCPEEEYAGWIELHTRRERRWFDVVEFLMREEPADLTAVLFDGVDKLQHLCWRFIDPELSDRLSTHWEREIRDRCEGYFRQLDELIARIVGLAGDGATVVLASDHGFGPSSDIFFLNTWLEQQGYLAWSADKEAPSDGESHVGIAQIARHTFELDWDRTVAFAATPSSQGLHLVTGNAAADGAVHALRDELVDALRRLRHPETGRPVVSEVHTRDETFAGPFEALAPDLTIMLEDNGVVSILRSETPFLRRPEPVGTHHPEGILLARGPALRRGVALPGRSIADVAPLILYSLDVPFPEDLDGRLPAEAFEPIELQRRPPRVSAVGPTDDQERRPVPAVADFTLDAGEEAEVLGRLRLLGYLD